MGSEDIYANLEGPEFENHIDEEEYFSYKRKALAKFLDYKEDILNPKVIEKTIFEFGGKKYGVYYIHEVNNISRSGRNLKMILVHTNISVFIEVLKDGREEGSS